MSLKTLKLKITNKRGTGCDRFEFGKYSNLASLSATQTFSKNARRVPTNAFDYFATITCDAEDNKRMFRPLDKISLYNRYFNF